jgi:hypothetical protein
VTGRVDGPAAGRPGGAPRVRRVRRAAPAILLGAAVLVLVAACGSSSTTPGPTSTPMPTPAASVVPAASPSASVAPTPAASDPGTASSLPPLTRVKDLEEMIPTTLGGYQVTVRSLTGTDVMASGDAASIAALQGILKATGKQPADYGFAWGVAKTGGTTDSVVGVFRVTGADPAVVRDALVAQAGGGTANVEDGSIGGKSVKILRLPSQDGTLWSWYYWPKGDVLFYVQSTDPTVAEKILADL